MYFAIKICIYTLSMRNNHYVFSETEIFIKYLIFLWSMNLKK